MERNSMGQFIAALRRAAGMTQQEVADRLNVSNRAVSRWERDESAPDLSLIPPLAELFGVSCDELLRGRRSPAPAAEPEGPRDARVEKQLRALVSRTLGSFRTLCWLSLAASAVGLVCMLAISYAFLRPIIGVAVGLLFVIGAVVLASIARSRALDTRRDNELFERAEPELTLRFDHTVAELSCGAFFAALGTALLGLPLVAVRSDWTYSVLSFGSYLPCAAVLALLVLVLWLWERPRCAARLAGQPLPGNRTASRLLRYMNRGQWGLTLAAALLFVLSPDLDRSPNSSAVASVAASCVGLACLLGSLLLLLFGLRRREERRALLLPGIRNLLYAVPALLLSEAHSVYWAFSSRYDRWDGGCLLRALVLTLLITAVFALPGLWKRRRAA